MFWELHRNCLEQDMMELSQLLAAFFAYAAGQDGLDRDVLLLSLPQGAPWLLEQIDGKAKNRKELQAAVTALFQLDPLRRRAIAEAVEHDMGFHRTDSPDRFTFAVPSLPEEEREIVEKIFTYFYETAFHRARGPLINGRASGATRKAFSRAYYQANEKLRRACPICLHMKSDAAKECSLEHYFPKGVYSPLILHPFNLIFICRDCNETYKGTLDALEAGKQPLSKVFLPYRDTVREHAEITFRREEHTDRVKLLAADGTRDEQERIDSFNFQYKLEARWSADIEWIFEQLRRLCANQGLSKDAVRQKLEEQCRTLRILSEFPDKLLESEYVSWLCETMFDAFYDSL